MRINSKYNQYFANPFLLNGLAWLILWGLYSLRWSLLCPPLSEPLSFFIATSSIISIFIGIVSNRGRAIPYHPANNINAGVITGWLIFLYILLAADIIGSGSIPLLGYLKGNVQVKYDEFGLPVVHVLVVNGFSALCLFAFYCYKSSSIKETKRKLIFIVLLSVFPFFLIFNRGGIIANVIGIFIISLVTARKPVWLLMKLVVVAIAMLFAFGVAGNIRLGKKTMDQFVRIAQPSDDFENFNIPEEFIWSYIYIATPLANTQKTIDHGLWRGTNDTEDFQKMVTFEMLPEMISKNLVGTQKEINKENSAKLVDNSFTACSVYGRVYNYMGWAGFWIMFVFILAFITINLKIIPKNSIFYVPMVVTLDIIVILNLFDDMLIFMGLVPQVFIFIMAYWISRLKFKNLRAEAHARSPKIYIKSI